MMSPDEEGTLVSLSDEICIISDKEAILAKHLIVTESKETEHTIILTIGCIVYGTKHGKTTTVEPATRPVVRINKSLIIGSQSNMKRLV